jgi:galactoside O-acetyltransferase
VKLGFAKVGRNLQISRKCSFYAISGSIGDNVRVDDFCILKGHIRIGSYVHIAAHCSVSGVRGTVEFGDFSTLSNGVSIFTGSDDYRENALSSSTVPQEYVRTIAGDVIIGRGVIVGAHSVVLPKTVVGDAASIGALCILKGRIVPGTILVSGTRRPKVAGKRDVSAILAQAETVLQNLSQKSAK